jgi:hypothetical protein
MPGEVLEDLTVRFEELLLREVLTEVAEAHTDQPIKAQNAGPGALPIFGVAPD